MRAQEPGGLGKEENPAGRKNGLVEKRPCLYLDPETRRRDHQRDLEMSGESQRELVIAHCTSVWNL